MTTKVPRSAEVHRAYHQELHPGRRAALVTWLAFTATFGAVRTITHAIRGGEGPLRDVTVGGLHVHHYLWGILLVSAVAGVAIQAGERVRRHPLTATAYGVGLALIVDEFALLLDLRDVYWTHDGRWSIDLAVVIIALLGSVTVGMPMLRRLARNRSSSENS